jgi:hypothetical protein
MSELKEEGDEARRALFVHLFRVNFVRRSTYHLSTLLEHLLGVKHLTMLILEQGHTPQMIDKAFPTADQLRLAFDSLSGTIANSALGYTVEQFRSSATGSTFHDCTGALADARLRDSNVKGVGPFAPLDHTRLFAVIESEMANGSLTEDPAWHDEFRSRRQKKKKVDWRTYMQQLLQDLQTNFTEAMNEIDYQATADTLMDGILTNTDTDSMMNVVVVQPLPVTLEPTQGPSRPNDVVAPHKHDEDSKAQRLGQHVRIQLSNHCNRHS